MTDFLLLAAPASRAGIATLCVLIVFILGSLWIGSLANRAMQGGTFLQGFFLGNRGLGAWALALTATVQSGGTFMGFPSQVYTYGWIVALWIAGYMVVPLAGFGLLAKRLAQLSRKTRAITVPDLYRTRFGSPGLGLLASLLILFYLSVMMFAQFKAGAIIMQKAWPGSGALSFSEEVTYTLTESHLAGLPVDVADRVQPIVGRDFSSEGELSDALGKVLTEKELDEHKRPLIASATPFDRLYLLGLLIFTVTVVAYTMMGGFLAAVWTDLFQSILMLIGVVLLFGLVVSYAGGLERGSRRAAEHMGPGYVFGPGAVSESRITGKPATTKPVPTDVAKSAEGEHQFLPLGLAFSFFFLWVFSGVGSPAGSVRLMASENTAVIRRSIYLLSIYNLLIYLPLICICICGRAILEDRKLLGFNDLSKSDEVIPTLALVTTESIPGGSVIAGVILAAPFGAVMATVSSYLVVLSSGLVRDVYQRFVRPRASDRELKYMSWVMMVLVGLMAVGFSIRPVPFLQALVVFSGSGAAATFCVPTLMLAFWRRATVPGIVAGMLTGSGLMCGLYCVGSIPGLAALLHLPPQSIGPIAGVKPYFVLGLDPILWGLGGSLLMATLVSLLTVPPPLQLTSKWFDVEVPETMATPV